MLKGPPYRPRVTLSRFLSRAAAAATLITARSAGFAGQVRFLAPGSMVCNLDFVESIFGNAENPDLAENDAALDPEHWTGTTGMVILAPQLIRLKKKDLGLPHVSAATERQKRDGMCYSDENELYNGGSAFKVTCRDARGVVVTVIADNYFGYCKKEVKTQLGMAANLYGLTEVLFPPQVPLPLGIQ
jgi:hypothetical protein